MNNLAIGILAHVDAGKTTLTEALLYETGYLKKLGRVDHRDAFLDNYELEKKRGITIFSKQAVFDLDDRHITLVDTPGHVDFSAEMERTLGILDYAILVISGADGVQAHTHTLWKLLAMYHIPVFLFVNKMDQPETDRSRLMSDIKKELSEDCIDFGQDPELLYDEIAMADERVLEIYMEKNSIPDTEIGRLIRERKTFPCFFGSALKLQGVDRLIEAMNSYMFSPRWPEEFGARVYKISRDERGDRQTFLKLTGGRLKVRDNIGDKDKVHQIRIYSGASYETIQEAAAGTVCAVTGLSETFAGQGLGYEKSRERPMLEPILHYQMLFEDSVDMTAAIGKLRELEEEEPLLHIAWNPALNEVHVQLMGDVQTEILKSMILDRFGLNVEFGPGNIIYRETVKEPVVGFGHYEPLRHYAEVHVRIDPLPQGSGIEYASECSEDELDRNWQRLILTHFQEREHPGVLTGSPITDVRLTLIAGRAHKKHTEGGDFRQATYRAIRQGLKSGESVLLEPWYDYRLEVPAGEIGRAMSDLQMKHGSFTGPELDDSGTMAAITGQAPACLMNGYQKEVLSYTGGKGRLILSFSGYMPCHNSEEVVESVGYDSERDVDNPTSSVFCAHGAGFLVPWYEVPDYIHLENESEKNDKKTAGYQVPEGAGSVSRGQRTAGGGPAMKEDAAFQAIYEREFGARLRQEDRYSGFRRKTVSFNETKERKRPGPSRPKTEKKDFLLVDGYNVIFAWEELKGLAQDNMDAARMKLAEILSNYQGFTGCNVILVFDAYKVKGNRGEVTRYHNIYVVYTKEAETADQYIEKTTHEIGRKHNVTVATSDGVEQVIVMGQGASRMSSRDLHDEIERIEQEIRKMGEDRIPERNYLFDQMDENLAALMEEIRLGRSFFQ